MSETPEDPNQTPNGEPGNNGPSFAVLTQYLKDMSFESPNAPASFQNAAAPQMEVNVDVEGRPLAPDQYEVELTASARATRDDKVIFVVEASYAGVFEIKNLPREQLEMAMLVECPRLLFPFMRQIIADATRNGNYPPLMLEPIDFMGIFLANKERAQNGAAGQAGSIN
ncbi:Protein-export protein SecB (maintains pre-export unfolded state) [hydrothermal vent metagenome]|uniref:Protein-export protein SecB (Maintains pre-export unfolded state) n=1 Tax=hydrothermal vent metagenome TaxID=652676 RepID=A0A3B0RMS1_9ZZZZ